MKEENFNSNYDSSNRDIKGFLNIKEGWQNPFNNNLALSFKDGIMLGHVINIFMSLDTKKIAAFEFRKNFWSTKYFVFVEDIVYIGNSIVFIDDNSSVLPADELNKDSFKSLKELRDCRVTTLKGKFLGKLEDIDVDPRSFIISRVYLDNGYSMRVNALDIVIEERGILVPSDYEEMMERDKKLHGILSAPTGKGLLTNISKKIYLSSENDLQKDSGKKPQEEIKFDDYYNDLF